MKFDCSSRREGTLLHQVESAGALNLTSDAAVEFRGNSSESARVDFTTFTCEILEILRIQAVHLFYCDVVTTVRHTTVRTSEIDCSLFCFWAHN